MSKRTIKKVTVTFGPLFWVYHTLTAKQFNSVYVYIHSTFHNTHDFKADLHKSTSKLCISEMYIHKVTVSKKLINLNNVKFNAETMSNEYLFINK